MLCQLAAAAGKQDTAPPAGESSSGTLPGGGWLGGAIGAIPVAPVVALGSPVGVLSVRAAALNAIGLLDVGAGEGRRGLRPHAGP
jgi:hypothetical protein